MFLSQYYPVTQIRNLSILKTPHITNHQVLWILHPNHLSNTPIHLQPHCYYPWPGNHYLLLDYCNSLLTDVLVLTSFIHPFTLSSILLCIALLSINLFTLLPPFSKKYIVLPPYNPVMISIVFRLKPKLSLLHWSSLQAHFLASWFSITSPSPARHFLSILL